LADRKTPPQLLPARRIHPMSTSADQSPATLNLRAFIDAVLAIAWSSLPDGSLDFINQRFRDYTGLCSDQLTGLKWKSAVHPDDIQKLETWWQHLSQSQQAATTEKRLRRFDGAYRWFQIAAAPVHDEQSNLIRWCGINTDIDDLKQTEEGLRASERSWRQIVDCIPGFVTTATAAGEVEFFNQQSLNYFGRTLEELKSWMTIDVIHPSDLPQVIAGFRHSIETGQPWDIVERLRRADGVYRWFQSHIVPQRDAEGRIIRWFSSMADIDDRKRAENELQKAFDEIKKLKDQLFEENIALRQEIDQASLFEEIVGSSKALRNTLTQVAKVASADSTVLITGETGTGKELVARAIHKRSHRSARAFLGVNCAGIPRDLIASELFGHEKGAFTGATQQRLGRFELAEGGTLFLDEVGELPAETQIALLRVLQEHEFERVGGTKSIQTDVRLIAATNRDLQAAIAGGTFRRDLYYRLNVFPIEVPSLRERREDIPLLVEYFIHRYARKAGKTIRGMNARSLELLQAYAWPGNIRELQNVIERSVIVCDTETFSIDESWLSWQPLANELKSRTELTRTLASQEKEMIEAALCESGGQVSGASGAAAKLGIPGSTLESKIKSLKINKNRFKAIDPSADRM
jgi:formate hydrogenlyase transcriptional activator